MNLEFPACKTFATFSYHTIEVGDRKTHRDECARTYSINGSGIRLVSEAQFQGE